MLTSAVPLTVLQSYDARSGTAASFVLFCLRTWPAPVATSTAHPCGPMLPPGSMLPSSCPFLRSITVQDGRALLHLTNAEQSAPNLQLVTELSTTGAGRCDRSVWRPLAAHHKQGRCETHRWGGTAASLRGDKGVTCLGLCCRILWTLPPFSRS